MYKELAYYDGVWGSPEEVQVPFNDRVHFFGDGVYDATAAGNHVVYLLDEHLDRFYTSAAFMGIKIPMEKEELGELLTTMLQKVEGDSHFVYWQVTRGVGARNHAYDDSMEGKIWIWIKPQILRDPELPISLTQMEDQRFEYLNVKTLNLMPSVLAAQKAKKVEVDETVLHRGNIVTECAHSNISILKDGILYSHPNDRFILRGIAKTHLIQACYRNGITVMEEPFTMQQLMEADEVIVTSSSNFCLHACSLDGQPIGGKDPETLRKIQDTVVKEYLDYTGKATL